MGEFTIGGRRLPRSLGMLQVRCGKREASTLETDRRPSGQSVERVKPKVPSLTCWILGVKAGYSDRTLCKVRTLAKKASIGLRVKCVPYSQRRLLALRKSMSFAALLRNPPPSSFSSIPASMV